MQRIKKQDIVFYQFEELTPYTDLVHGVFTRLGGVSGAPFASLNVGLTVGDPVDNVYANRQRVASALGFSDDDAFTTWQVHGADVIVQRDRRPQSWPPPKADAIVTAERDLPLTMRYADCVPLVFYDPRQHAIGIAHAGWRGTLAGVGPATVRTMEAAFGSQPDDIVAGIGPSIGPCCYEVGPEVVEQVAGVFEDTGGLFEHKAGNGKNAHLNLWAANERLLRDAGVMHIEVSGLCTASMTDEFFSHRAEHGQTGRFAAAIMLRGAA
jgi:YfiH family protein